ncbi:hypothetical protein AVEN_79761-1 [Araneus ventricosus]|uniref:Uncharacterized protein n=1 Tax=Araneus ventricosus TaxID=182803 RepID=A0A4Y2FSZ3_ARAVE|nr:hypothetical protein AVEN_79761-1 [Araneus ventricosus]
MEFKYHLPSSQHHVKEAKDSSCITMIETSEQVNSTNKTTKAKPTSERSGRIKKRKLRVKKKHQKVPNSDQFNQPFSFIARNSIAEDNPNSCQKGGTPLQKIYQP